MSEPEIDFRELWFELRDKLITMTQHKGKFDETPVAVSAVKQIARYMLSMMDSILAGATKGKE